MSNAFHVLMTSSSSSSLPVKPVAKQAQSPKRLPSRNHNELRPGTERVACPACDKVMPMGFMNVHLDLECGKEKGGIEGAKRKMTGVEDGKRKMARTDELVLEQDVTDDENDIFEETISNLCEEVCT